MAENQAAYDAYLGVEIELPDGTRVRCKPLTFARALHFTRLLDQAQQTGGESFYRFLEEFAAEVKTEDGKALADLALTAPEVFEVGRRFLWRNRLATRATPAGTGTNGASSAGTTSSPSTPTPTEARPTPASPGPSSSPS